MPASTPLSVGILGATGAVGQKFVRLLSGHPWFRVVFLAGSPKSAGRPYQDAVNWLEPTACPAWARGVIVRDPTPDNRCDLVFSALDASVAQGVEPSFAAAGIPVFSNARSFRMDPKVPLIVPEVNGDHAEILRGRPPGEGFIVANPNCSTTGLVLPLKPLHDAFTVRQISVTTLQALSGAGYPGVSSLDILGNVVPLIPGEDEKLETEPLKILGLREGGRLTPAKIAISAQANRVPVLDGHLLSVSVGFEKPVGVDEAREVLSGFESPLNDLALPTAPKKPLELSSQEAFPQPRLNVWAGEGMSVCVGRLRECPVLHLRFVALVHNTVRGAAGGALLNAELLHAMGILSDGHVAGDRQAV